MMLTNSNDCPDLGLLNAPDAPNRRSPDPAWPRASWWVGRWRWRPHRVQAQDSTSVERFVRPFELGAGMLA